MITKAEKVCEVIKNQVENYDKLEDGIQIFLLCEVYNMIQVRNIIGHPKLKPVPEHVLNKIIERPCWLIDKAEMAMFDENMFKKPLEYIDSIMNVEEV